MSILATTLSQPGRSAKTLAARIGHLVRKAAIALQVRAERRQLQRLDDAALKDMGFNKGQAQCEATRTFWDVPVDRLRT